MTQIAIGRDGKVNLWCDVEEDCPNGRVKFFVNNGAWSGSIMNGKITIDHRDTVLEGAIMWRGTAPFPAHKYNAAIAWIEQQIADK